MPESRAEMSGACEACPLEPSRRQFLRQTKLTVVGALLGLGLSRRLAWAMEPTAIAAQRFVGTDPTYAIPPHDDVQIDRQNAVILVRWQNVIYAFNLSCPHQNTALRWHESDAQFQCPKHHSKYRPDGAFISGRATRSMDRFPVTRSGNEVIVNVNHMIKEDVDKAAWNAAMLAL